MYPKLSIMKKNNYLVKVTYTFEGVVQVRADNKKEATKIVIRDFGGATIEIGRGSNNSDNPNEEGIVEWDFDMKPIKSYVR